MIGEIIDSIFNIATDRRDYNRQVSQYNQQYALQKEQFYKPMQVRVADLKAAGLHPSLAAGMNHGQVVSAPSLQSSGRTLGAANIQNAIEARKTSKLQQEQIAAQTDLLRAQANDIRTNTPIKGQVSTVHGQQAPGTQKLIEDALPAMVKAVGKHIGDERGLSKEQYLLYSPEQMEAEKAMYGDDVVEIVRGIPNFMYNQISQAFHKYGKGRTFTQFIRDNSRIIRALTRSPNSVGSRGRGTLKKLSKAHWR